MTISALVPFVETPSAWNPSSWSPNFVVQDWPSSRGKSRGWKGTLWIEKPSVAASSSPRGGQWLVTTLSAKSSLARPTS
jgi:hypothetical protein